MARGMTTTATIISVVGELDDITAAEARDLAARLLEAAAEAAAELDGRATR